MNEQVWGAIALLALGGWAATLVMLTRSQLGQARALETLHKVDKAIDDRITTVVERIRTRQARLSPRAPEKTKDAAPLNAAQHQLFETFGGPPVDLGEQPDADERLEILS